MGISSILRWGTTAVLLSALFPAPLRARQEAAPPARWVERQTANVAYLYGFNWNSPQRARDVVTFEYGNRGRYGDQFLFLDVMNLAEHGSGPEVGRGGTATYGEWQPRLALGRLIGLPRLGPVEVLTAHEINFSGTGLLAHLHGLGTDWALPRGMLKANLYLRDDVRQTGSTWQVLVGGLVPFRVAGVGLTYGGFADWIGREGAAPGGFVSHTQLLADVGGAALGQPGQLLAGVELHAVRNRGGAGNQLVPQAMVKWVF